MFRANAAISLAIPQPEQKEPAEHHTSEKNIDCSYQSKKIEVTNIKTLKIDSITRWCAVYCKIVIAMCNDMVMLVIQVSFRKIYP